MSFTQKNENRKNAKQALVAKHGDSAGAKLFRDYRADRRQRTTGGAFGNLDTQDFNHFVIGTTGAERVDTGDAER